MRRVFAAFLVALIVLVAFPATATHRQAPYEEIIRWARCTAALVTSDERGVVESYYAPYSHQLYVGTQDRADLPQRLAEMILFHEIGHCLQRQAGLFDGSFSRVQIELDADRWAAEIACSLGRDGKRDLHDLFVWAKETFGYEGDPDHGTLIQRIAQGKNAALCNLPPTQAPILP